MSSTEARRLPTPKPGKFADGFDPDSICYYQDHRGVWMLYLPGAGLGDLSEHDVTEHEGGTITVSPSILVTSGRGRRHGYLRKGSWEPCGDDQPPASIPDGIRTGPAAP